jgi:hypothetical protein
MSIFPNNAVLAEIASQSINKEKHETTVAFDMTVEGSTIEL